MAEKKPALPVDPDEPLRVARTAEKLKLKYVVKPDPAPNHQT